MPPPAGLWSIELRRPWGDPIVASVFEEEPLINLTAAVHDEAPVFLGKGLSADDALSG